MSGVWAEAVTGGGEGYIDVLLAGQEDDLSSGAKDVGYVM